MFNYLSFVLFKLNTIIEIPAILTILSRRLHSKSHTQNTKYYPYENCTYLSIPVTGFID